MDPEPTSPRWNSTIAQGALYLGVDGGSSRCRARIEDEFGTVVSDVAGTGSIGVGLIGGRELRFGGYGFSISDEGSGADVGSQAIRLTFRAADQRGETLPLLAEVLGAFDHDSSQAVAWSEQATAIDYPPSRRWCCGMPVRAIRSAGASSNAQPMRSAICSTCSCGMALIGCRWSAGFRANRGLVDARSARPPDTSGW
jgi:hypothetical protein